MSCIYLDTKFYNEVLSGLRKAMIEPQICLYKIEAIEDTERMVREWFCWNDKAFCGRYNHPQDAAEDTQAIRYTGNFTASYAWLLKALKCIDYQCSDAKEWHDSYSKMQVVKFQEALTEYLLNTHTTYAQEPWASVPDAK